LSDSAWNKWRRKTPEVVIDLSGAQFKNTNLAGIDFAGTIRLDKNHIEANLQGIDLTLSNLTGATFNVANLAHANLFNAMLTEAKLCAANLSNANLTYVKLKDALVVHVNLTEANLSHSDLSGAKLNNVISTGARFTSSNFTDVHLIDVRWVRSRMLGKYQGIRGIESTYGNALFKRDAKDQDYIDTLLQHWSRSWRILLWLFWWITDFGRSFSRLPLIGVTLIIMYGATYSHWPGMLKYSETATWFTPFYFSIVTYTTLGFGDVVPATVTGEIVVSTEVIFGYLSLGLLLAVLADKVARRS
jgi:hypothetical protein